MDDEILEKAKKLLDFAPEEEVDKHALNELESKLYQWENQEVEYLADLEYFINGKEYQSLIDAIYQEEALDKIKINVLDPNLDGKWNFTRPTKELKEMKGKGVCKTFEYDPTSLDKWSKANQAKQEKVMVRGFLTDFYVPISIKTKSDYHRAEEVPRQYDPTLQSLAGLWDDMRDGLVPIEIRLSLYTKKDRYSLILDPLCDKLKPHPLKDITLIHPAERDPMEYMKFDHVLAWVELPPLMKKVLELLFEGGEDSIHDIANEFSMDSTVAENNLGSLESKGFVKKHKDIYYDINMEKIKNMAEKLE